MPLLSRIRSFWNTVCRKERLERELDQELRGAVETPARGAAMRTLGSIERVKEDVREARIGAGLDALLLDARYAFRGLCKAPGFTSVVLVTLALGIGANTAIFSVVHAVVWKSLPYRDADRLVFVWLDRTQAGYPRAPMSGPDLRDLRERTRSFADVAAIYASGSITLTGGGVPEQVRFAGVTANFFQVIGADAALGRTFLPEDSGKGAEPTIVLGWDLFERRFGTDPTLIGRRISIDNAMVRVVGVMPEGFRLLLPADANIPDRLQAWTPFGGDLSTGQRRTLYLRVLARMKPGVTVSNARDDVDTMARAVSGELGSNRAFTVVGLQEDAMRDIRGPLLVLFVGVGILLAIACVNVASLLIARAASRARETAVRFALGANRMRLVRQTLVEGMLLTGLGAVAGVLAGYGSLRVLLALTPESLSRLEASRLNGAVFAFTLVLSVCWGLLFSLAPLAEMFKPTLGESLRLRSAVTAVRYRFRAGLIIAQIALSTTLLVSAGLLVHAFVKVLRVDPGFKAEKHLTFRIAIPERYESREAFNTFAANVHSALAAVSGVTGVGAFSHLPYDDIPNWGLPYSLEAPIPSDAPLVTMRAISPGLFETLGVRLLEGRFFNNADQTPKNPVAIVDDLFARQMWPGRSAIGRTFHLRLSPQPTTVIGVVGHLKLLNLVTDVAPQVYVPWPAARRNPIAFVVGTSPAESASLTEPVRAAVAGLDAGVPIYDVRPMKAYLEEARSTRRFTILLASVFALTALALTCVGVYGVLAFAVSQRRHEFGVRRALGASAGHITSAVLREGLTLALIGAVAGLAGAVVAGRLLQSQLYAVSPGDPVSYAVAIALILTGSVVACWIPARRATAVSPMDALRSE